VDRYYDPSTDQFLTVDPDLAETGQAYAFTGDDPLNATDPLGLKCKKGHSCPAKPKPKPKPKAKAKPTLASTPFGGVPVTFPVGSVTIPGPTMTFTIASSVTIAGPHASQNISVSSDGSVDVKIGNAKATFSSEGAMGGLTDGSASYSSDGASYTVSQDGDVGPDHVTVDTTATIGYTDRDLPGSAKVGAAVGTVVAGATYLGKQIADACTANAELC
jgi:hypothetical protein